MQLEKTQEDFPAGHTSPHTAHKKFPTGHTSAFIVALQNPGDFVASKKNYILRHNEYA